jgi:rubredoxin
LRTGSNVLVGVKVGSENDQLRQQLKDQENWESQKSQYRLENTERGAVVYVFTGTPKHYACPSCIAKQTVHILQDERLNAGTFECPNCKYVYPINPRQHSRTKFSEGGLGEHGWMAR